MENNNNSKITPMDEADEVRLIMEAQAGNERAMERLLDAYSPVIEKVAHRHSHGDNYEDAVQEVRIIFLTAVREHDLSRGGRLYTYIGGRLGVEMNDILAADNQWGIPARTMQRFDQILKAADNDEDAAAAMAPKFGMSTKKFIEYHRMTKEVKSIAYSVETSETGTTIEDTFDGPMFGGGEVTDAYDAVIDRMTVEQMMADSMGDEHDHIVRMAYGFEGNLDVGEDEPVYPVASSVSLAAHDDGTVASALTWEQYGDKNWTRQTVQRRRTAQIKAWGEKYAESNVSTGKDN